MNTQYKNMVEYKKGALRCSKQNIVIFKFFGNDYTTNFNRMKPYSLDSIWWVPHYLSFFTKLKLVITKKVKKL